MKTPVKDSWEKKVHEALVLPACLISKMQKENGQKTVVNKS